MKKIKKIASYLLVSLLGVSGVLGYQALVGDIPATEIISGIKSFAGTVFVAIGGTGGVLLLAESYITSKINAFKAEIDKMVANNEMSVETATLVKSTADMALVKSQEILEAQQSQIDTLISENKTLRDVNTELVLEIRSYISATATALIEEEGE